MNRPIIGVSCNFRPQEGESGTFNLEKAYIDAIYKNGGIPQIIPVLPVDEIPSLIRFYDGILLSGGGGLLAHINEMETLPSLSEQNPVRYEFEKELTKYTLNKKMPILGICRGLQMINEVLGGTIKNLANLQHQQNKAGNQPTHKVFIQPDSHLYKLVNNKEIYVNSFHRQAVDKVGKGLKVSAYSDDNVIEGIEGTTTSFVMGLQFHPEFMLENEKMMNIYKTFINATKDYKDSPYRNN